MTQDNTVVSADPEEVAGGSADALVPAAVDGETVDVHFVGEPCLRDSSALWSGRWKQLTTSIKVWEARPPDKIPVVSAPT